MTKQSRPSAAVAALRPSAGAVRIEPEEGWAVSTEYGTLRLRDGTLCVRLGDVHAWLCARGEVPREAVLKLFSPFTSAWVEVAATDDDKEALARLKSIFLMRATATPAQLVVDVKQCPWPREDGSTSWQPVLMLSDVRDVQFYASAFPAIGHVHLADGTAGGLLVSLGEGALRVWHGPVRIEADHLAARRDQRERENEAKYYRWPSDDDLRLLLARLAVPVEVAHELWGWGRVVPEQQDAALPPAPAQRIVKKSDLVGQLRPVWKNIESDLKEMSKPSHKWLKDVKVGRGLYDLDKVVEAGKKKGRIRESEATAAPPASPWPGGTTVHRAA